MVPSAKDAVAKGRIAALLVGAAVVALTTAGAQTALRIDGAIDATAGGLRFPDGSLQVTGFGAAPAPVEDTGQQDCFDLAENVIPCAGTGQDAEFMAGIDWAAPRFEIGGDGTVTDKLTGLIWLRDASCFGERTWEQALADANTLAEGFCSLTDGSQAGDWRLPNVRELQSLVDLGRTQPALPPSHPFIDVDDGYWTSTSESGVPEAAWAVSVDAYESLTGIKSGLLQAWPVRGGV